MVGVMRSRAVAGRVSGQSVIAKDPTPPPIYIDEVRGNALRSFATTDVGSEFERYRMQVVSCRFPAENLPKALLGALVLSGGRRWRTRVDVG